MYQFCFNIHSILPQFWTRSILVSDLRVRYLTKAVCVSLFKEKRVIFPLSCFSLFVPSLAAVDEEDKDILARKTCERIQFSAEEDSWVN